MPGLQTNVTEHMDKDLVQNCQQHVFVDEVHMHARLTRKNWPHTRTGHKNCPWDAKQQAVFSGGAYLSAAFQKSLASQSKLAGQTLHMLHTLPNATCQLCS